MADDDESPIGLSLKDLMDRAKKARKGQLDVPTVEHVSFIPTTQHSNLLLMKSHKSTFEDMITLAIGSIRENYTLTMFDYDVKQWKQRFPNNQRFLTIPIMPHDTLPDAINSRDAIKKIEKTLLDINQLPPGEKIRLIILGTGQAGFLYEAITYLLREWKEPDGQLRKDKYMQFITSGDTKDHDMSSFCQWLCISEVCETIEFYNTMHYHAFGFCAKEYSRHR